MKRLCLLLVCLSLPLIIGCGSPAHHVEEHVHSHDAHEHEGPELGPHKGAIIDWGGGKFHVELIVDQGKKQATLYILGSDERTPTPVKATDIFLTIDEPSFEVKLVPQPLERESAGASSRFIGTHDNLGIVHKLSGEVSGLVEGTPYVGQIKK